MWLKGGHRRLKGLRPDTFCRTPAIEPGQSICHFIFQARNMCCLDNEDTQDWTQVRRRIPTEGAASATTWSPRKIQELIVKKEIPFHFPKRKDRNSNSDLHPLHPRKHVCEIIYGFWEILKSWYERAALRDDAHSRDLNDLGGKGSTF